MRQSVKSKGSFYGEMAASVEDLVDAGGPAVAKAARFLSDAVNLAFREKLIKQQHALFECATSMTEVETAVALTRSASRSGSELAKAQARAWASDVALSVTSRLTRLFAASDLLGPAELDAFVASADHAGAVRLSAGRLADLDFIAREITRG
jgi:hypothetical protein